MKKGFTLIEVIIYIGLFTLLMGTVFIAAYQIINSSGTVGKRTVVQNEGNFVMRKINWSLTGIENITTPSSSNTTNLKVTKYDGTKIEVCLYENKIKIHEGAFGSCGDTDYTALTTDNVEVSNLDFKLISIGSETKGIQAILTITEDGIDFPFTITKYIRQ